LNFTLKGWPRKDGVLAVALADYAGFEPVQRLVAGAVFDGDVTLDPSLATQIARLQAVDAEPFTHDSGRAFLGRCSG
jgi:hypothetical protein